MKHEMFYGDSRSIFAEDLSLGKRLYKNDKSGENITEYITKDL